MFWDFLIDLLPVEGREMRHLAPVEGGFEDTPTLVLTGSGLGRSRSASVGLSRSFWTALVTGAVTIGKH